MSVPGGVAGLVAAKRGRRVAVVLPALDEEATVGAVVAGIAPLTAGRRPLVDELVVLDSGSTDATAARARAAGARVVRREQALPQVPVLPGKGEALWRSLAATTAELVCFVDADLVDPHPDLVPRLLGPLLTRPGTALVKGYHQRPLGADGDGGGRVTELVARPLLAALRPELASVVQPLGGEYAATRELLESVPFATGYGVEIGLLIDTLEREGSPAIAQADLGVRRHRNRPLPELGVMARQVTATALARCGLPDSGAGVTQFVQVGGEWLADPRALAQTDRPPLRQLRGAGGSPDGAAPERRSHVM